MTAASEKTETVFRMCYRVVIDIRATPEAIWSKLTDAPGFPRWNSTVSSIEGCIALGEKLAVKVPIAPDRTFSPKVVAFETNRQMVWQDGWFPMFQGTRTYTLTPIGASTTFEMAEVFRGMMLPMIKGSLPDFRPVFDQYAADLKKACEVS